MPRARSWREILTGALTRHKFEQGLNLWQKSTGNKSCKCVLLLFDLDRLRQFNEEYGHNVGDRLLKHFAETSLDFLGADAEFARIGDDEFALFLPGAGAEEARALGESLQDRLERTPLAVGLNSLFLTVTVGAALHSVGPVKPANLILRADTVLQIAKHRACQLLLESELV